ncbi:MAG TPA: (2Fe-2S) ferredoxin domain-containing protein [Rectinemataceae bacterium]|nr:(2Fe-2S) ferredoxin domain-containing protein [Rectinemataceae bacterium]
MARMTLDELRALRDSKRQDLARRDVEGKDIQIIVGMGTCGIAAGAKLTFDALVDSIQKHGLENKVLIRQTGCMGLCYVEPTVEVLLPGMPTVIYGKMTAETAEEFVQKHLIEHTLLDNHIFDRPAADIIVKAGGAKSDDAGLRGAEGSSFREAAKGGK